MLLAIAEISSEIFSQSSNNSDHIYRCYVRVDEIRRNCYITVTVKYFTTIDTDGTGVQLTVIVVAVLMTRVRREGVNPGAERIIYDIIQHFL